MGSPRRDRRRPGQGRSVRCRGLAVSCGLAWLLAAEVLAQGANPDAADHMPLASGNWWVLGASAGERFEIRVTEMRSERDGTRLVRVDDSNGDYRLLSIAADRSISLLELHRLGQAPLGLDPPLVMLPGNVAAGARHEHQTMARAFDPSGDSEPQQGSARAELAAARIEAVRTPAGRFEDCLALEGQVELAWSGGESQVEKFLVWLAPGVGPVRLQLGPDPRRATDLRLLEARVGDRSVPAEP